MRYRDGANMYTEREMSKRMRKLSRKVRMVGGCDILLTHAPAAGMGDLDDLPHRGFECFNTALESWGADYMVHGHVHQSYGYDFQRERQHVCGTTIINAAAIRSLSSTRRATPSVAGMQPGSIRKPCAASSNATSHRVLDRQNPLVTATKGTLSPLWRF